MQKNLNIWHYWNGTYSKIKLRPGKTVALYQYQTTDEGWNSDEDRITLEEDGTVTLESVNDGRDCDGRLTRSASFIMDGLTRVEIEKEPTALMIKTKVQVSEVLFAPNWREWAHTNYDEYAQAAGY